MGEFKHSATLHKDGSYSIGINLHHGYMTPDELIMIGQLAKKYKIKTCMATTGKKINLMEVQHDDVNPIWDELESLFGDRLIFSNGKMIACPGAKYCKYSAAHADTQKMATDIAALSLRYHAGKVKVGISGCTFGCSFPKVRDIGVFASPKGWNVSVGGNGGAIPAIGEWIAKDLSYEEALRLVEKIFVYLQENKREKERSARVIKRLGIDHLKNAVLS